MTLSPASSRGVLPTFESIRFSIAFDTPGLIPETFPITGVAVYPITSLVVGDSGDGSFTVAGDHTAAFPVDSTFAVIGSTGNDGPYTVESASFAAGHTTVAVPEFFYDATPDGSLVADQFTVAGDQTAAFAPGVDAIITNDDLSTMAVTVVSSSFASGETIVAFTDGDVPLSEITPLTVTVAVGAVVYTPTVGDMLLGYNDSPITLVSVSEAWDGSTPKLRVLTEAYRQGQLTPFVTLDATVADDTPGVASILLSAPPGFTAGTRWRLWRFTSADPILVQVVDNNGLDPGSTQGAGEIVLLLIPAA